MSSKAEYYARSFCRPNLSFAGIKTEVKPFMVEPIFILRVYRVLRHIVGFRPDFRFLPPPLYGGWWRPLKNFFTIWRYNGSMARPTKFSEETSERLLNFISAGFTITQACRGVNISTDTCSRWRQKDLDFNKKFIEATKSQQWGSAAALAKYGCRTYKRKARISPNYGPAPS